MNQGKEILKECLKAQGNYVVARAGKCQQHFDKLFKLFLSD